MALARGPAVFKKWSEGVPLDKHEAIIRHATGIYNTLYDHADIKMSCGWGIVNTAKSLCGKGKYPTLAALETHLQSQIEEARKELGAYLENMWTLINEEWLGKPRVYTYERRSSTRRRRNTRRANTRRRR